MELAAIATAAVPGLAPTGVAGVADDADDFDAAVIVDAQQNRWRVRSPRHGEASMRLETELTALRSFTPGIRAALPFRVPSVAGTVRQGGLRTFVYNHVPGRTFSLEELVAAGGRTAEDIGRSIAAIHGLPDEVVDRADLPSYTANEFRTRRLNELDQAATTGRIPPRLLRRWEHALEDIALWRFNPTVVHGDLHEENLLLEDGRVTAVMGWTDLRIGDPADDLAWLAATHEQSFADAVVEAYVAVRAERSDPHIMRRAALAAEFALAQWLTRAIAGADQERVEEAEQMLRELDEDIAEFGGQPISIVEPPSFEPVLPGSTGSGGPGPRPEAAAAAGGGQAAGDDDGAVAGASGEHGETRYGLQDRTAEQQGTAERGRDGTGKDDGGAGTRADGGADTGVPATPASADRAPAGLQDTANADPDTAGGEADEAYSLEADGADSGPFLRAVPGGAPGADKPVAPERERAEGSPSAGEDLPAGPHATPEPGSPARFAGAASEQDAPAVAGKADEQDAPNDRDALATAGDAAPPATTGPAGAPTAEAAQEAATPVQREVSGPGPEDPTSAMPVIVIDGKKRP